ncbi:hypothetical protein [Erythrobacter ani]|uniref:Uncharacterized protein n=1 Tax=Erythrobacter ani TaxID=2827235 RepID=A0ABS6SL75_9SPHN|nr:hypothetical protein [Erythrobacter ani]MBV7265252.1 hypothetical protein [Erythrobacter ani]
MMANLILNLPKAIRVGKVSTGRICLKALKTKDKDLLEPLDTVSTLSPFFASAALIPEQAASRMIESTSWQSRPE